MYNVKCSRYSCRYIGDSKWKLNRPYIFVIHAPYSIRTDHSNFASLKRLRTMCIWYIWKHLNILCLHLYSSQNPQLDSRTGEGMNCGLLKFDHLLINIFCFVCVRYATRCIVNKEDVLDCSFLWYRRAF